MMKVEKSNKLVKNKLVNRVEFPPLLSVIIVFIVFAVLSEQFATIYNVKLIATQITINGIMGIGLFLVILTGGIDISVGSALALYAALTGMLFELKIPFGIVMILVPAIGALIGYGIGLIITKLRIPDLIATLAAQYILRGVAIIVASKNYATFPEEMKVLGQGTVFGAIPISTLCFIAVAIIIGLVLHKNNFGKKVYAVGGNMEAASLAGIDVQKIRRNVYTIEGALVGLSAILYAAMYGNVVASYIGVETINTLLAAVLIGGVNMNGGRGTVLGTCFGVLLMGVISNGMISIRLNEYWVSAVTGVLILGALLIQYLQYRSLKSTRKIRLERVQ